MWQSSTTLTERHDRRLTYFDIIRITPDATAVVATFDNSVTFWRLTTGVFLRRLEGHTGTITDIAFSSSGRLLASSSKDGSIRLWDVKSKTHLKTLRGNGSELLSLAFSSDGRMIASGTSDGSICIWKVYQ
jgi:WD40 repeat protein